MNLHNIEVGNVVAKIKPGFSYAKVTFHPVTKVTKVSLTLDDGSVWTKRGEPWGKSEGGRYAPYLVTEADGRTRERYAAQAKAEEDYRRMVDAHIEGIIKDKGDKAALTERVLLLAKFLAEN